MVSILLLSFISALMVWGQSERQFEFESVKDSVNQLKQQQSIVVEKAKDSKISSEDKANADSILTKAFASLNDVLGVYNVIKEDSSLEHEAQTIVVEFIDAYRKAIFSADGKSIQISNRNFLKVAESSSPKLDTIYQKAKYIAQHPKESEAKDNDDIKKENNGSSENPSADPPSIKESSSISTWDWIAMGLGIIGMLLGGYAIICVNAAHKPITERLNEISDLENRLAQRINEIKPSSYRGPAANSYVPQHQYTPEHQLKRKESVANPQPRYDEPKHQVKRKVPVANPQPRYGEPKPQQPIIDQRTTISNLFATIKAGSLLAEFFKVSTENSGDKVFMLTLTNPEAEVADFTIVPNMAPDFMKSVIIDRDTYLPAVFCEKSIDSQNPSRIEVLSQGRAKKVDGKWQVQERMSIRLV